MAKLTVVECKHCGWNHMGVSRKYAEDEVKQFNEYFDTLSPEKQDLYYGGKKSSVASYEFCFGCGKPSDMQLPTRDIGDGHTIQSVIWEPKRAKK